jgi:hypothetical protein
MNVNIFEQASRQKFRFESPRTAGRLTTEDLWELSLEDLDEVAKNLNKRVKASAEESFIKKVNTGNKKLETQLEVVKSIINTKLEDQEKRKLAADRKAKRTQLIELIAQKEAR